jgi:hypothetical protein
LSRNGNAPQHQGGPAIAAIAGPRSTDSAWRRAISGVQRGMTLPINVRRG